MTHWHTGSVVQALLTECGMRAEDLAARLGVSRATAFNLLNRERWASAYLEVFADWLDVDAHWLDQGSGAAPPRTALDQHPMVIDATARAEVAMREVMARYREELIVAITLASAGRTVSADPLPELPATTRATALTRKRK